MSATPRWPPPAPQHRTPPPGRSGASGIVVLVAFGFLVAAVAVAVYVAIVPGDGTEPTSAALTATADSDETGSSATDEIDDVDNGGDSDVSVTEVPTSLAGTSAQTTASTEAPSTTVGALRGDLVEGRVTLSGVVPSDEVGASLVAAVEALLGPGTVDDTLTIEAGAAVPTSLTLTVGDSVIFEPGSETIALAFLPVLDDVVSFMELDPNVTIVVEGHTDNDGDQVANLALSQRRAEAARTYIVDKGINRFRVEASGRGDTEPVADNGTAVGRAENRRLEFEIRGLRLTTS